MGVGGGEGLRGRRSPQNSGVLGAGGREPAFPCCSLQRKGGWAKQERFTFCGKSSGGVCPSISAVYISDRCVVHVGFEYFTAFQSNNLKTF